MRRCIELYVEIKSSSKLRQEKSTIKQYNRRVLWIQNCFYKAIYIYVYIHLYKWYFKSIFIYLYEYIGSMPRCIDVICRNVIVEQAKAGDKIVFIKLYIYIYLCFYSIYESILYLHILL